MKKFFKKVEQAIFDLAVEKEASDFIYTLETGKYMMNVSLNVETKKLIGINGRPNSHRCYKVTDVEILDENEENVASRFPHLVERMKKAAPDYQEVINELRDMNLTETERVFGSEAGYLRYKFGY